MSPRGRDSGSLGGAFESNRRDEHGNHDDDGSANAQREGVAEEHDRL